MKRKTIFKIFRILIVLVLFYLIGWYLFGGKRMPITMNSITKERLINTYELTGIKSEYIVSFEHITYLKNRANVLIIKKSKEVEEILKSNTHIQEFRQLKRVTFPYPNVKYMPYGVTECCCFFDDDYYYLSVNYGGTEYNDNINDFFWETYSD